MQEVPRRILVPLRPLLKQTLDSMTADGIIAPISKPTPWISSLMVAPKKEGKHLNAVIKGKITCCQLLKK